MELAAANIALMSSVKPTPESNREIPVQTLSYTDWNNYSKLWDDRAKPLGNYKNKPWNLRQYSLVTSSKLQLVL